MVVIKKKKKKKHPDDLPTAWPRSKCMAAFESLFPEVSTPFLRQALIKGKAAVFVVHKFVKFPVSSLLDLP